MTKKKMKRNCNVKRTTKKRNPRAMKNMSL